MVLGMGDPKELSAIDESECVDPSLEDPESWECDCLANMVESCGDLWCLMGSSGQDGVSQSRSKENHRKS